LRAGIKLLGAAGNCILHRGPGLASQFSDLQPH
jgi:hypothetical protein